MSTTKKERFVRLALVFSFLFLLGMVHIKKEAQTQAVELCVEKSQPYVFIASHIPKSDIREVELQANKPSGKTNKKIVQKENEQKVPRREGKRPYKKNATPRQQEIIDYAWDLTGCSDFIYTIESENANWNPGEVSKRNRNGSYDYGICQLCTKWHYNFIYTEEFQDWKAQVRYCWGVYQDARRRGILKTTFYGREKLNRSKKNFYWK